MFHMSPKKIVVMLFVMSVAVLSTTQTLLARTYHVSHNPSNYTIDSAVKEIALLLPAHSAHPEVHHLFSHGRSGALFINGQWLQKEAIVVFLQELNLSPAVRHLNIYGCNFAQGAKGRQAVSFIEKQLGLSIAASTNITGKDGDWILETGNPKNVLIVQNYQSNLQDTDGDGINDGADLDDDNDGILDTNEGCGASGIVALTSVSTTATVTGRSIDRTVNGVINGGAMVLFMIQMPEP